MNMMASGSKKANRLFTITSYVIYKKDTEELISFLSKQGHVKYTGSWVEWASRKRKDKSKIKNTQIE